MKVLPHRYAYCAMTLSVDLPASGDFIPSKSSAARLLRTRPDLLGWKRSIYWFPFLLGNSPKGNRSIFKGIDSAGQVLVVEAKTGRTGEDPFKGLLRDAKTGCEHHGWATARTLRARCREFFGGQAELLDELSMSQKHGIERALDLRDAAGNPPPIFIVLLPSRQAELRLSEKGLKNLWLLEELVGPSKVLLRGIKGKVRLKEVRIDCWSPRSRAVSKRRVGYRCR